MSAAVAERRRRRRRRRRKSGRRRSGGGAEEEEAAALPVLKSARRPMESPETILGRPSVMVWPMLRISPCEV